MSAESPWRPVRTADGSPTLVHAGLGEACHSAAGAWSEARERHVLAAAVPRRLGRGGTLAVLDVGTGPGISLAALVAAARGAPGRLAVTTLEHDPRAPLLAGELAADAPPGAPWKAPLAVVAQALRAALAAPGWVPLGDVGRLRLLLGDARDTLPRLGEGERFDVVFLDPFSPRVDPALWAPAFLAEVAERMGPGSILTTYSAATAVRAALLAAGLSVRLGPRVGSKREGTLAGPDLDGPALPRRLARRLARRAAQIPQQG